MRDSQEYIKSFYPDFFDKDENSNFSKLTKVLSSNLIVQLDFLQHLQEEFQLFNPILEKKTITGIDCPLLPIFIHRIQNKPYQTEFHFVCIASNIKSVTITDFTTNEIEVQIDFPDLNNNIYHHKIIKEDEIISHSKYKFEVRTHDEYTYIAESDKINTNLDKIGKLWNVPRREYIPVTRKNYPYTDPPYCIDEVESDYNYVCRLYKAIQKYHKEPLVIWHLWVKYGLEATLKNRKHLLFRIGKSYVFKKDNKIHVINQFDNIFKKIGDYLTIETVAVDNTGERIAGKFGVYIFEDNTFKFHGNVNEKIFINVPHNIKIITRYFKLEDSLPAKGEGLQIDDYCSPITEITVAK